MESNITKILIKKFWKRRVTLPCIAHMRYGPPLLVLTFTDDPPLRGLSPSPPKKKRTFPRQKQIFHQIRKFVLDFKGQFAARMSQNQAKSNYKDCSFGNRDFFFKGTRLSALILAKSQAGRKFEVLEAACLVRLYTVYL